jgi:hypothetical protein
MRSAACAVVTIGQQRLREVALTHARTHAAAAGRRHGMEWNGSAPVSTHVWQSTAKAAGTGCTHSNVCAVRLYLRKQSCAAVGRHDARLRGGGGGGGAMPHDRRSGSGDSPGGSFPAPSRVATD